MTFPAIAYDLNKYVEKHAYEAYGNYLKDCETELKSQPVPEIARDYYEKEEERYMITACDVNTLDDNNGRNATTAVRRNVPSNGTVTGKLNTLYDVFERIRDDELDHARTMEYLEHKVLEPKK
jgi:ubiquinol oxidase